MSPRPREPMADRLEDLLRACTVRVVGGPEPGAGFFIAPGKVLTCVHVIATCVDGIKVSPGLRVQWERDKDEPAEFPVTGAPLILADKGRAISALDCDYPDIALLEVAGPKDHPCVGIDTGWPANSDGFQLYGYPREGGTIRLTPASLRYRGKHGNEPTLYLDLASEHRQAGHERRTRAEPEHWRRLWRGSGQQERRPARRRARGALVGGHDRAERRTDGQHGLPRAGQPVGRCHGAGGHVSHFRSSWLLPRRRGDHRGRAHRRGDAGFMRAADGRRRVPARGAAAGGSD